MKEANNIKHSVPFNLRALRKESSIHPFSSAYQRSGCRGSRALKVSFLVTPRCFQASRDTMYLARNREKVGKSHSNIPFIFFFLNFSPRDALQTSQAITASGDGGAGVHRHLYLQREHSVCLDIGLHSVTITLYLFFTCVRLHCVLQCALIHLSAILCFPFLTSSHQLQATCCLSFFPPFNLISSSFHPRSFLSS